jgi:tetratricopeptide (TPR) repeat protein
LRWLVTVMNPDLTLERYSRVLATPAVARMTEERMRSSQQNLISAMAPTLAQYRLSPDAALTMVLAAMELREEALGTRTVAVRMSVGSDPDHAETILFLKEKGRWGLLGGGELWDPVGDHAAGLIEKNPDLARRLLEVAGAELAGELTLGVMAFRRSMKIGGPEGTTLAAAVLSCLKPQAGCLDEVEAHLGSVDDDTDRRILHLWLGHQRSLLDDWAGAARVYGDLWAGDEDKGLVGTLLFRMLLANGDLAEADRIAAESQAATEDTESTKLSLRLARQEHKADLVGALETMRALEAHDTENDYSNNRAWYRLIVGQGGKETTSMAEMAARKDGSSASVHTLATAYAEEGRPAAAHDALIRAMKLGGRDRPGSDDWYVIGRIAELYGEPEAAVLAYERVAEPTRTNQHDSTWELAVRRLAELKTGP